MPCTPEVAIVPSAMVNQDGTMSMMLADRVTRPPRLYLFFSASRRSSFPGISRPMDPTSRPRCARPSSPRESRRMIYEDHAGSHQRHQYAAARDISRATRTVVTQGFHMKRSSSRPGGWPDANGPTSDGYGGQGKERPWEVPLADQGGRFRGAPVTGWRAGPDHRLRPASWGPEVSGDPRPAHPTEPDLIFVRREFSSP